MTAARELELENLLRRAWGYFINSQASADEIALRHEIKKALDESQLGTEPETPDPLNMSNLCRDWTPTGGGGAVWVGCPADKTLALDLSLKMPFNLKASYCEVRRLICRATSGTEELWGLRCIPGGKLQLSFGTARTVETIRSIVGRAGFSVSINFSPATSSLSAAISFDDNKPASETIVGRARNQWASPAPNYDLTIGCQNDHPEPPMYGWLHTASWRLTDIHTPPVMAQARVDEAARRGEQGGGGELVAIGRDLARLHSRLDALEGWARKLGLPPKSQKQWCDGLTFEEVHAMILNGTTPGSREPGAFIVVPEGFLNWLQTDGKEGGRT